MGEDIRKMLFQIFAGSEFELIRLRHVLDTVAFSVFALALLSPFAVFAFTSLVFSVWFLLFR